MMHSLRLRLLTSRALHTGTGIQRNSSSSLTFKAKCKCVHHSSWSKVTEFDVSYVCKHSVNCLFIYFSGA